MLWLLILLAVIFAFANGLRDSSSILAGVISSKALPPRLALNLIGIAELAAPFLFGVAVAKSITTGLVKPGVLTVESLTAAMASALLWTLYAWIIGIPSSSSHALIGGILGSAMVVSGLQSILTSGIFRVVLPLFLAPLIGLAAGYLIMNLTLYAARNASPRVNSLFRRLQIITMLGLALSHSANDTQKSIGMITMGLLLSGKITAFDVPIAVTAVCAITIAFGASRGDWRLIKTLGRKIYAIKPINSFTSQAASTVIIMISSILGAPVSTSQVISMSLLGAGGAERMNKVRWQVGGEMLITWLLTLPVCMLLAALLVKGMAWLNL